MGIIFLWFGLPKLFPGVSAAESLAAETTERLTFGAIEGTVASVLTGGLEAAIGIFLISGKALAPTIIVLLGHMVGTFTPLFLFPDQTWKEYGICTLEGQYILKSIVLVTAAFAITGHAKSSRNSREKASPPDGPLQDMTAPRADEAVGER
ncbi:hypothetical protein [Streptomyces sp. KMM 9044]|uniref:hypothetical protein n=1 Tax=Streptomyces sp. KMM 9044 TaxID=2744474 RepID=UPI002151901A|nr:hypothetical protein [Streptomyces sp. KMM 9044]WAX82252.1 hypothetical protein HUV60_033435 [Streptomyces sp. KMM 9044]